MPASIDFDEENKPPRSSQPSKKKLKKEPSCSAKLTDTDSLASKTFKHGKTKAKLSLLPSLPLDILFEIFGHLTPLDLLYLARTTRGLRSTLLHRSAMSIWKTSLRQIVGLPERPQDMSEPAWANLVYSSHCHNCLTSRVEKVDWLLRIRLCKPCIKSSKLLRSNRHLDSANKLDKIVLQCVPFSSYHIPGLKATEWCFVEDERKFLKDLRLAEGDRSAFVKSRKEALAAREAHAAECKSWVDSLTRERWDELDGIRHKRRAEISEKLEELGFIEELEYLDGLVGGYGLRPALCLFDDHPDIKVPKPLTARTWKNIESRLVDYMHEVKAHRLAADRLRVVRQREKVAVSSWVQFRLRYPAERLLPSGTDILSWEKVKAIIELPSCVPTKYKDDSVLPEVLALDAATGDDEKMDIKIISPASFIRVFESMTAFISKWEQERTKALGEETPVGPQYFQWRRSPSEHMKALQLAACVFTCEDKFSIHRAYHHYQCGAYPAMWFPEFLHHPCNTVTNKQVDDEDVPENPLFKASKEIGWCRRKEWSPKTIFFDEKASRAVKRVLEACGLDYNVVTTQEMDVMDPRFICLKCSYGAKCDGQRPRMVMPWRNAVQHCMLVHWGDASVTWERIPEESAIEARTLSATRRLGTNIWRCAHCRDSSKEREGKNTEELMKEHLDDWHDIIDGVKGRDYFQAVDCPPTVATVKIIPKAVGVE
ncbi:hypothetical protein B0H19DRAFT_987683 [Mycena capillaripes]|nr:hypothetical protein B0H19DRAFT_987683 [Mycena capillaripes]